MKTKYVTVVAIVLVLLSTALIVSIPKGSNDSDESESKQYGFFLDGVEDGDGFGVHIVTDEERSYKLLRDALLSIDPKVVPMVSDGEFRELISVIQNNPTLSGATGDTLTGYDGQLSLDVSVSGPEGGHRNLQIKFLAKGGVEYNEDISSVMGMPDGVDPYSRYYVSIEVSGILNIFVDGDMISAASLVGNMSIEASQEYNVDREYVFPLGYINQYVGDNTSESHEDIQMAANVSFEGVSSVTELMDMLTSVESTKSLTVKADALLTAEAETTSSDPENSVHDIGPVKYINQEHRSFEFEIPAGTLALMMTRYGISEDDFADYYGLFKVLAQDGLMFETAYPILKKLGAEITRDQYDALASAIRDRVLPEYQVLAPLLEANGYPIDEDQYEGFRALSMCFNGDLSYENLSSAMVLASIVLTEDQYSILRSLLDDRMLPEYDVFYAAYGDELPISVEQYNAIRAYCMEGTLPEYATIAPILEVLHAPLEEDAYLAFVQMYADLVADRTYATVCPYLESLGITLEEAQYNLINGLITDRESVGYEDYRAALETMGIELTEEGYASLMEFYSQIGPDMTPSALYGASEALGLGLSEAQCGILISAVRDRTIPAYDDMQPILEIMGVDIDRETYDLFKQKYEVISTLPGYFGMQAILEEFGYFVSEETYDASAGFLRSLYNGLADYKNGPNTLYYMDWKDKAVKPENKAQLRGIVDSLEMPEAIQRYVVTDADYNISVNQAGDRYTLNLRTEDDGAILSDYFDGLTLVPYIAEVTYRTDFEVDGVGYRISSYSVYEDMGYRTVNYAMPVTASGSEVTIPANVTYDGTQYPVRVNSGVEAAGVQRLIIEAPVSAYALSYLLEPSEIVVCSMSDSDIYGTSLDPSRFTFVQQVDGIVFATSVSTSTYYNGNEQVTHTDYRASVAGFIESRESYTIPERVRFGGNVYTVTNVRNIFDTTVGTLDIPDAVIRNMYSVNINGVQSITAGGNTYIPGSALGIDSTELCTVDSEGGIWTLGGYLIGFSHPLEYYSVGDNKPANFNGFNIRTTCPVGIVDISGLGYTIRGFGCVDTLITSNIVSYYEESDLPQKVVYRGIPMERSSSSPYSGLVRPFYFVTDDGAIMTIGRISNSQYSVSALTLEGFTTDKSSYSVPTTVYVDGVGYYVDSIAVDLHHGTAGLLSARNTYPYLMMSVKGVQSLWMPSSYYSDEFNLTDTESLRSIYNVRYTPGFESFLARTPGITHIEFTDDSSIPWSKIVTWYEQGKEVLAKLPSDASFTGTNVTVPYSIGVLNIDSRIGEMVETIRFTGKVDSVVSSPSATLPSNLRTIIFDNKVDSVDPSAFYGCQNLEAVIFNGGIGSISGIDSVNAGNGLILTVHGDITLISVPSYSCPKLDLSMLDLDESSTIGTIRQDAAVCSDPDVLEYIVSRTNNVEYGAIELTGDTGMYVGTYYSASGTGNGYVKGQPTSGDVQFYLYKADGTVYARATSYSGSGIPSTVTYGGITYPVGQVSINSYSWSFPDGYMEIPAGVEVVSCYAWDNITDIVSYSTHLRIASYPADGGLKTVMKEDGQLFAFIGTSTTGQYTVPAELKCSVYELENMFNNKAITHVEADGVNPSIRVYNAPGSGYSSIVSNGILNMIRGPADGLAYVIPSSVTGLNYSSILDRAGVITVERGNSNFKAFNIGGYNSVLYGNSLIHVYGSGQVYTIPSAMSGTYYSSDLIGYLSGKLDLSTVAIEVEQGNRTFSVTDAGDFRVLTQTGTVIYAWKTGSGSELAIPISVSGIDFTHLNDCGITTVTGGSGVTLLSGTISNSSTIASVSITGKVTRISSNINGASLCIRKAIDLTLVENAATGTYTKTEGGVTLYYVAKNLVYASVSGNVPQMSIVVDAGTKAVSLNTVIPDVIFVPWSVSSYSGSAGIAVKLPARTGSVSASASTVYNLYQQGGTTFSEIDFGISDVSVDGTTVSFTLTAPERHTFDDGSVSKAIVLSDNITVQLVREKVTVRYVTGADAVSVPDATGVWFDDYVNNYNATVNRGGYDFAGWYFDENCTLPADSGKIGDHAVNGVVTLYAKWVPQINVTICYPDGTSRVIQQSSGSPFRPTDSYAYFTDADRNVAYEGAPITESTTLYASVAYAFMLLLNNQPFSERTVTEFTVDGSDILFPDGSKARYPVPGGYVITGWQKVDLENSTSLDDLVWIPLADGTYTEDALLMPILEEITYLITFVIDADKGACDVRAAVETYGGVLELPEVRANDGYRFVGWVDGLRIVRECIVTGDMTLEAGFVRTDVQKVTLSYQFSSDCITDASDKVRHEGDVVLSLPDVETYSGREFLGWKSNGEFVKAPFIIRGDMVLEAALSDMSGAACTVVFISDGRVVSADLLPWNAEVTAPTGDFDYMTAEKVYRFIGWEGFVPGMVADRDYTFNAQFDESVRFYTVTFKNGEETVASFQCEYNHVLTADEIPAAPEKPMDDENAYTPFWSHEAGTRIVRDTEITVQYTPEERVYDIVFMSDGTECGAAQLPWGAAIEAPALDPVREMTNTTVYTFIGWFDGQSQLTDSTVVTGHATFTARFSEAARIYTVTFMNGSDVVDTLQCEFDHILSADEIPAAPGKEMDAQYTYTSAWSAGAGTRIIADRTVDLVFTPHLRSYEVAFKVDGALFRSVILSYGDRVVAPADIPEKVSNTTLFSFTGWQGLTDSTTVTGDMSFEAGFSETVRLYTVVFMNGSDVVDTLRCEYDHALTADEIPAAPGKEMDAQYTYTSAWSAGAGTRITADTTIELVLTSHVRSYTITFLGYNGSELDSYTGAYGSSVRYPLTVPEGYEEGGQTYVFAGWEQMGTITQNDTCSAIFKIGEQRTNDDGSTTTVVEEDGKVTETTVSGEGTQIIEKESGYADDGTYQTTTETVKETVKDQYGQTVGSTETVVSNSESEEEVIKKTQTTTYGSTDEAKTADVTIDIGSKTSDVSTSASIKVDEGGNSVSTADTVIGSKTNTEDVVVNAEDIATAIKQLDAVSDAAEEIKSGTSVEKTVTVNAENGTKDQAKVSIPASSMGTVGDSNASFAVKAGVGTIKIDSDIASHLSSKADVGDASIELSISNYTGDLTSAQKRVVGDHKVIQLTASINGEYTGRDLGGKATVTVPYELRENENPLHIVVFFIDDDGTVYKRVTVYDMVNHTITFETDHFSYYVIGDESAFDSSSEEDSSSMIVTAVIVAVIAIAAVAIVAFCRKH